MLARTGKSLAYSLSSRAGSTPVVRFSPSFAKTWGTAPEAKLLEDIDLLVCGTAGVTIEEGGVVYKTMRQVSPNS